MALAVALLACAAPDGSQVPALGRVVVFSAVRGRVLQRGKPVAGATVVREFSWVWNDETGRDSTTTGPDGEFTLPKIERSSVLSVVFPHEPVIGQDLTIRHGGKAYDAWTLNKYSYDENGENAGRPLRLLCRLEARMDWHGGGSAGICDLE